MREVVLNSEDKISIEEAVKNNGIIAIIISNDIYVLRETTASVFNFYELIKGNILSICNYKSSKIEIIKSILGNYKVYYFSDNVEFLSWASQQVLPF